MLEAQPGRIHFSMCFNAKLFVCGVLNLVIHPGQHCKELINKQAPSAARTAKVKVNSSDTNPSAKSTMATHAPGCFNAYNQKLTTRPAWVGKGPGGQQLYHTCTPSSC
eukprot:485156-Pelagomonas_calceolata.AAC.5